MQHAHLAGNASANVTPIDDNAALALVLDPSIQPEDLAPRMGLSLIQLAAWARDHASQLADLKDFFTTRATLIASRLHMASLAALERVVTLAKDPDPKTQERSRKAASTILRNLAPPSPRAPSAKRLPGLVAQASPPLPTSAPPFNNPATSAARPAPQPPSPRAPSVPHLPGLVAQASPPVPPSAPLFNNLSSPAARLRATVGSAPQVIYPCIRTALVLSTFAVRELLLPTPPHRIPA